MIDRDVCPVIPNKRNRVNPWRFDAGAHRDRNIVERLFAKSKLFRRFATRYGKRQARFHGLIHLVLGFIRVRSTINTSEQGVRLATTLSCGHYRLGGSASNTRSKIGRSSIHFSSPGCSRASTSSGSAHSV
jgi:hypothetical protein